MIFYFKYPQHESRNVMVWSCFSLGGVGPLVRIDGNTNRFLFAKESYATY